jgi:hypothetical protein
VYEKVGRSDRTNPPANPINFVAPSGIELVIPSVSSNDRWDVIDPTDSNDQLSRYRSRTKFNSSSSR